MRSSTIFILASAALAAPALAVPASHIFPVGTNVRTPEWYRTQAVARDVSDIDESGAAARNINWQQIASSVAGILPYVSHWLPTGEKSEDQQQQQQQQPQRRELDAMYELVARSLHENYRRENDVVYELLARAVDDLESGAINWQDVADTAAGILPHLIPFLPDGTPKAPKPRSELHEFLARAMDELD